MLNHRPPLPPPPPPTRLLKPMNISAIATRLLALAAEQAEVQQMDPTCTHQRFVGSNEPNKKHGVYEQLPRHACGVTSWRQLIGIADAAVAEHRRADIARGHVYQFGVFTGDSMRRLFAQLPSVTYMWGFDSFKGLPREATEAVAAWGEGEYADDPRAALRNELGQQHVGWVQGFYNESLRDDSIVLSRAMKRARYVDIDADLYTSSRDALDFMFRNKLVAEGTIVGYDDWWVIPCANHQVGPLDVGEGRAHAELSRTYDVEFHCLAGACMLKTATNARIVSGASGAIFIVVSIGRGRSDHGFHWGNKTIQVFRRTDRACRGWNNDAYRLRPMSG